VDLKSLVYESGATATLKFLDGRGKLHTKSVTVKREAKESKYHMELSAIHKALENLNTRCVLNIQPMQLRIRNEINMGWPEQWKKNNWTNAKGKKCQEQELWSLILKDLEKHTYRAS